MDRRRRPVQLLDVLDEVLLWVLVPVALVYVAVFVVGSALFGLTALDHNDIAEKREGIVKLLLSYQEDAKDMSEATRSARRETAAQMLNFEAQYQTDEFEYFGFSEGELKQLQEVKKTGKPIELDTDRLHYSEFLAVAFSQQILLGIYVVLSCATLYNACDKLAYNHRLADLPWRRGWPWVITLLGGPPWWIAMFLSSLLLKKDPPLPQVRGDAPVPTVTVAEDGVQTDTADTNRRVVGSYVSAPRSARETYTQLRIHGAARYREEKKHQLESKIENSREHMRTLGKGLQQAQDNMNKLKAQHKLLLATEDTVGDKPASLEVVGEEFDRMMKLPGVLAVQVVNSHIRLIVRAIHHYEGVAYDLGDWQIDFGADLLSISAQELRSGVKESWRVDDYPVYRIGGGFCFGERVTTINEHMRKSQYLEAIALAVECLHSVNENDRKHVPKAFYTYKEEPSDGQTTE